MKILSKQPFMKINTQNAILFDMRKYRHLKKYGKNHCPSHQY